MKDTSKKICPKCEKEKDIEDEFYKNPNSKDGFENICKECKGQQAKDRITEIRKKAKDKKVILNLDLTGYPEVAEVLEEEARVNIRSMEYQALYYVIQALKCEAA